MGRKLRGISGQEAVKAFKKFGYSQRKGKGSHVNHVNLVKLGSNRLTIPLHTELSVGLLANEIKKAGLSVDEFLELLGR